jgi:hypothetical protein
MFAGLSQNHAARRRNSPTDAPKQMDGTNFISSRSTRCHDVKMLALEKRRALHARIAELSQISRALEALIAQCGQGDDSIDNCRLFAALESAGSTAELSGRT